jgi:hypothetical protein
MMEGGCSAFSSPPGCGRAEKGISSAAHFFARMAAFGPAASRRTKRIYQFDPQNVSWMVGESAKRLGEAGTVGGAGSFCALTDHLAPFLPLRTVIHRHGIEKKQRQDHGGALRQLPILTEFCSTILMPLFLS